MKTFKTDQVIHDSGVNAARAAQVEAIKKVVQSFNDEGKSDEYVRGFYEMTVLNSVSSPGAAKKEEQPASTENEDLPEEDSLYEDSADEIEKNKQARLNMKGK